MDIKDVATNASLVESVLGAWPSFHDAEVMRLCLDRDDDVTVRLAIKAVPYDPVAKREPSLLVLLFSGVYDVTLAEFNQQNVLWSLDVEERRGQS